MGLRDKLFGRREPKPVEVPALLQPEDPVNYDSVLDWLLGLSQKDYERMLKVVTIYRNANKDAAKVLRVKDEPTTQLVSKRLTDEQIDSDLDMLLQTDPDDLKAAIENEPEPEAPKKAQAPSKDKKVVPKND